MREGLRAKTVGAVLMATALAAEFAGCSLLKMPKNSADKDTGDSSSIPAPQTMDDLVNKLAAKDVKVHTSHDAEKILLKAASFCENDSEWLDTPLGGRVFVARSHKASGEVALGEYGAYYIPADLKNKNSEQPYRAGFNTTKAVHSQNVVIGDFLLGELEGALRIKN